jgi:hypothetical protein
MRLAVSCSGGPGTAASGHSVRLGRDVVSAINIGLERHGESPSIKELAPM